MSRMNLHFLDARGALSDLRDWLDDRLSDAFDKGSALLRIEPVDVVVKAGARVLPEKGHVGYAPEPGLIYVTVDPANPVLAANADASLERMFVHELHHAARWDGPGYGNSLGEALVSEGLAGHFAQEIYGGPLEPWERLPRDEIRKYVTHAAGEWDSRSYDHEAWFFGTADFPGQLGYSMGFQLVADHLMRTGQRSSALVHEAASAFRPSLDQI
ncbi:DUF2268 domain-containing putative Zn-dependent protease [Rhizobium sp. BK379]|uniref:DUF2268 domain-containing putative Zn-dependent protease n=1 Tax=Rhizobium sp. BK379 TaxID=2587059 RepID=UPI000DDB62BE|nr:DUF2268 domain-containing putative Zn-dependent protease [Rhizobium sp. BK379]MBB3442089.1 uncharacterized protein YjaZ [Rhizobium sp. BK379]